MKNGLSRHTLRPLSQHGDDDTDTDTNTEDPQDHDEFKARAEYEGDSSTTTASTAETAPGMSARSGASSRTPPPYGNLSYRVSSSVSGSVSESSERRKSSNSGTGSSIININPSLLSPNAAARALDRSRHGRSFKIPGSLGSGMGSLEITPPEEKRTKNRNMGLGLKVWTLCSPLHSVRQPFGIVWNQAIA